MVFEKSNFTVDKRGLELGPFLALLVAVDYNKSGGLSSRSRVVGARGLATVSPQRRSALNVGFNVCRTQSTIS